MTDFHHFSSWIASDIDGFHPLSCFLSFLPLRAPLRRVSISSSFFPRNISKSLWVPKFCVFREIWVGPRLCVKEAANAVMFTVPPSGSIQHGDSGIGARRYLKPGARLVESKHFRRKRKCFTVREGECSLILVENAPLSARTGPLSQYRY